MLEIIFFRLGNRVCNLNAHTKRQGFGTFTYAHFSIYGLFSEQVFLASKGRRSPDETVLVLVKQSAHVLC
jgi:hypothetical protein